MVELVDLVGQLSGHFRLGLRAPEEQDAVERLQRGLAVARHLRDERRPRTDEARVGEVEDGPEIGDPVLDGRTGERQASVRTDAAQLLGGIAGRVLDGLRFVEHHRAPHGGREHVDVANGGRVRGDDDVGVDQLSSKLIGLGSRHAVVHQHA